MDETNEPRNGEIKQNGEIKASVPFWYWSRLAIGTTIGPETAYGMLRDHLISLIGVCKAKGMTLEVEIFEKRLKTLKATYEPKIESGKTD